MTAKVKMNGLIRNEAETISWLIESLGRQKINQQSILTKESLRLLICEDLVLFFVLCES